MLSANYSEKDRAAFQKLRYTHPNVHIMRCFEILCLHACGMHASGIAVVVGQNPRTVRNVINMFKAGGIELVSSISSNHPESDLEKHRGLIDEDFRRRPPASSSEAVDRIEKLTGLKRSGARVRVFMAGLGMRFRKSAAIPAKADLEKQEEFKKKRWSLK